MATAHLIHGFNVCDGGRDTVGRLAPALRAAGWQVRMHDYGWTGPLRLRFRNEATVERLLPEIEPGDCLVGHSNGCLIAWQLADMGAPVDGVVCIQPALRRDTQWSVPALCLYNPDDIAVRFGRIWSRLASIVTWRWHGWGAAGAHGFNPGAGSAARVDVTNWNTDADYWRHPAAGHSAIFARDVVMYWARLIAAWLACRVADMEGLIRFDRADNLEAVA